MPRADERAHKRARARAAHRARTWASMHWPTSKSVQLKATRSRRQPAARSTALMDREVRAGSLSGGAAQPARLLQVARPGVQYAVAHSM